jgi:hypothetical protein
MFSSFAIPDGASVAKEPAVLKPRTGVTPVIARAVLALSCQRPGFTADKTLATLAVFTG